MTAQGYTTDPGSGGGPSPSGTVSSGTAFGTASNAGAAGAYSRGDHQHGTPAAPTPGSIGAATAGHDHAGVYQPVGSFQPLDADLTALAGVTVTTKGDLLVATGSQALTRLGAGSNDQVLTADSAQASGVKWATPAAGGGGMDNVFPLAHWGFVAATGDPGDYMAQSSLGNNTLFLMRMWVPAGAALTNLWIGVSTAGSGHDGTSGENRLALYDDSGTRLGQTPDTPTMWTTTGWRGGALSGGPYAAQGSGRFVYVGCLARGWSVSPGVGYITSPNDLPFQWTGPGMTHRRTQYTGGSAHPASFTPGSTGTPTGYNVMMAAS